MKAWCSLKQWGVWRMEMLWGWSPRQWDCSQREPLTETGSCAAAGCHTWERATNMLLVCYSANKLHYTQQPKHLDYSKGALFFETKLMSKSQIKLFCKSMAGLFSAPDPLIMWWFTLTDAALVQVEAGNRALKAVFGSKLAAKGKSLAELLQPHSTGKQFSCSSVKEKWNLFAH